MRAADLPMELNLCRIPGRQSAQKPFDEWFVGVGFKRVGQLGLRHFLIADDIPEGTAVFSFGFRANGFDLVAMKKGGLTVAVDHRRFRHPIVGSFWVNSQ